MKLLAKIILLTFILTLGSCTKDDGEGSSEYYSTGDESVNGNGSGQSGLITAGEWNDLENWNFWNNLLISQEYSSMPTYWSIFTNNRVSVLIVNNSVPVINAKVELLRNGTEIWTAKTDNYGRAELWVSQYQKEENVDTNQLTLKVNEVLQTEVLSLYNNTYNTIEIATDNDNFNRVEISFIVDTTGSMGDEIEFLKADLKDVIDSVKDASSNLEIYTSSVFYRDVSDSYLVKKSEFTNDLDVTIDFIQQQSADGGGDFPEAVHSGLDVAINDLQWSDIAKTRIAFLVLDAPPHYQTNVILSIQSSIKEAAKKGIKIIPITASGIDKETEFLMRDMAILTNGTYVFITNDSGIGGEHIEASVGEYQVEYLNNLMVRLINKYSE